LETTSGGDIDANESIIDDDDDDEYANELWTMFQQWW
jgi:hypothetical protein